MEREWQEGGQSEPVKGIRMNLNRPVPSEKIRQKFGAEARNFDCARQLERTSKIGSVAKLLINLSRGLPKIEMSSHVSRHVRDSRESLHSLLHPSPPCKKRRRCAVPGQPCGLDPHQRCSSTQRLALTRNKQSPSKSAIERQGVIVVTLHYYLHQGNLSLRLVPPIASRPRHISTERALDRGLKLS